MGSPSKSNWNLEMLVFVEGGKPENPEKNPRGKAKTNNKFNRVRESNPATLVAEEGSRHCKKLSSH